MRLRRSDLKNRVCGFFFGTEAYAKITEADLPSDATGSDENGKTLDDYEESNETTSSSDDDEKINESEMTDDTDTSKGSAKKSGSGPKTGDDSNAALYITAFAAAAGIASSFVMLRNGKKHRRR